MDAMVATDRELLTHYVSARDGSAFRHLVARHGTAVHRVCRGVLKDSHEAEDAFQATFLLLARKAPEIRDPEALSGWLRGVAYRVAIRARRRSARRRAIETMRVGNSESERPSFGTVSDSDLRELLDAELSRLPEDYRQPIRLCYLDGLTHQEAARRLSWPVGTVKVRLVRGRRMLRERLDRRGVTLGAALLLMLPRGRQACASTHPLIESTMRAMSLESAGRHADLVREFPDVAHLARAFDGAMRHLRHPALWAAAMILGVALTLGGPVARVLAGPPVSDVDPAAVPDNLLDVLQVDCR